jgi:hypothetical protein
MSNKIKLALAIAVLSVLSASVGTSFAAQTIPIIARPRLQANSAYFLRMGLRFPGDRVMDCDRRLCCSA